MTPEQFQKVKQPVFMGYYYKDEEHQDKVVSVPAMLAMFDELGTPADKKQKMAFPNAGEHVIASHFTSGDLDGRLSRHRNDLCDRTENCRQLPYAMTDACPSTPPKNNLTLAAISEMKSVE